MEERMRAAEERIDNARMKIVDRVDHISQVGRGISEAAAKAAAAAAAIESTPPRGTST